MAQEGEEVAEAVATLVTGDTAWMLTSTVLVLLMTLPGLALFYGGLVRSKNIRSVFVQCLVIAGIMSLLWVVFGYSLAAGEGNSFFGNFTEFAMLKHMAEDTLSGTIPESVWVTFQMTFVIITPALIVGAFAERMKFAAVLIFTTIWTVLSYLPVWHMAWGGGLFHEWGVIDFAGGTVVHINAGIAGLVACVMLGKRRGFPTQPFIPHNVPFTVIGACLLWVGWFGFNAGSAGGASGSAGFAMITTQIATAAAVLGWLVMEKIVSGKPTAVGAATGAVAGLVAITPASGSTTILGAMVIGLVSSVVCYFFATRLKRALGYDDSLDVFGVHGIGGIIGAVLTGVFLREGASDMGVAAQMFAQIKSVLVTAGWSAVCAVIGLFAAKVIVGLRVDENDEVVGLDQTAHGEGAYHELGS
ncbi:MAG: ammonium transporter [Verrucomicrobiales bacterium]|nr:ammonium transporter [Verrucomicrobiales bacterium]